MASARIDAPDFGDSRDSFLWPDERTGPWVVRVDWTNVGGRYECVGIEVRSYRDSYEVADEAGERITVEWPPELPTRDDTRAVLTASVLRRLALGEVLSDLRRGAAIAMQPLIAAAEREGSDELDVDLGQLGREQSSAWLDDSSAQKSHRDVAAVYTAAWRAGRPPTKAVAEHFTISQAAAAKRVARAREAGLLPKTRRGMPQAHREDD